MKWLLKQYMRSSTLRVCSWPIPAAEPWQAPTYRERDVTAMRRIHEVTTQHGNFGSINTCPN